jgi:hypothetical protein
LSLSLPGGKHKALRLGCLFRGLGTWPVDFPIFELGCGGVRGFSIGRARAGRVNCGSGSVGGDDCCGNSVAGVCRDDETGPDEVDVCAGGDVGVENGFSCGSGFGRRSGSVNAAVGEAVVDRMGWRKFDEGIIVDLSGCCDMYGTGYV